MLRFTIRDLLWLMVVVACLLRWALSGTAELEQLKAKNNQLEKAMVGAAVEWAKEKGEPAFIDAGEYAIRARPDGTVSVLSRTDSTPSSK